MTKWTVRPKYRILKSDLLCDSHIQACMFLSHYPSKAILELGVYFIRAIFAQHCFGLSEIIPSLAEAHAACWAEDSVLLL